MVNDATGDRTYEYTAAGNSNEDYALNNGNSAPRGAASTAVGDKVWVVDANKKVYVYNPGGGLLGSWTAGSLASNATVEGIATNGTDVWIVDAKQDKVFRYTGAASRLSGSQNAASSFSLNSSNTGPKDIVTDGTSLWVVNDSTTDKVFKYTLSGSLLGSWTIAGAGTSPTGITLDPSGGGNLWIVDSGTKRVYQFDNARGSRRFLSPSTSFALSAGNTNPQGIADPPTGRSVTTATHHHAAPPHRVMIGSRLTQGHALYVLAPERTGRCSPMAQPRRAPVPAIAPYRVPTSRMSRLQNLESSRPTRPGVKRARPRPCGFKILQKTQVVDVPRGVVRLWFRKEAFQGRPGRTRAFAADDLVRGPASVDG